MKRNGKPLLFVYGTLRNEARNKLSRMLAHQAKFIGRAQMNARLYHLGDYPGLVPSDDPDAWVQGEVYVFKNPNRTLASLDDYEGCGPGDPEPHEFERMEGDVIMETGEHARVWVYLYKGSLSGRREIATGDYLKSQFHL